MTRPLYALWIVNGWPHRCVTGALDQVDWEALLTLLSCQGNSTISKQRNKTSKCDRKYPCSICTATGSECQQGNLMTYVTSPKRVAQLSKLHSPESTVETASRFSLASHVGQIPDGTWVPILQSQVGDQQQRKRKYEEPHTPRTRRQGLSRPTALQEDGYLPPPVEGVSEPVALESDGVTDADMVTPSEPKGKKRKIDGDDDYGGFIPHRANANLEAQEDEVLTSKGTRAPKRKPTANRNGVHGKYHQPTQGDKPAPYGQPLVWADKRQSLCETLPYYRAYQSGAYMSKGVVRAFMVDREVGPRDKFEEEIMISRV
jgi:hypothetical protein